jgi:Phage portal protein
MGILDFFKSKRLGRDRKEPPRDTAAFPNLVQMGNVGATKRIVYKPTPRNLRYFAQQPYTRRAINAIKNPIALLDWEVVPIKGVEMNRELERQIEVASYCLDHPNGDDSFRTFAEQVVEDILLGAGAVEMQTSGDESRPLWMWPVDGLTIQIFPGWSGGRGEARYVQIVGYGNFVGNGVGQQVLLRNDELIYIRPNPTSATPFGRGPAEIAFNTISRILGVGEFAGLVATNARPSIGLDLGDGATSDLLGAFKQYWRNEVEGQGNMPIFAMQEKSADGKARGPSVLRFYPEGDEGLYLKYQEFLLRELAAAFDLSPQNLGIERDVNRNTSETAEDRDRQQAIKPTAHLLESHLTREAIHGKLGFSQLKFQFVGIEQEDEESLAKTYQTEYAANAVTPNEYRERRGMPPSDNPFSDMLSADVEIAKQAARGAAVVDDKELGGDKKPAPKQTKKKDK